MSRLESVQPLSPRYQWTFLPRAGAIEAFLQCLGEFPDMRLLNHHVVIAGRQMDFKPLPRSFAPVQTPVEKAAVLRGLRGEERNSTGPRLGRVVKYPLQSRI